MDRGNQRDEQRSEKWTGRIKVTDREVENGQGE